MHLHVNDVEKLSGDNRQYVTPFRNKFCFECCSVLLVRVVLPAVKLRSNSIFCSFSRIVCDGASAAHCGSFFYRVKSGSLWLRACLPKLAVGLERCMPTSLLFVVVLCARYWKPEWIILRSSNSCLVFARPWMIWLLVFTWPVQRHAKSWWN